MIKVKERGKWLAALALCLSCFLLCATLLATPTLAEETPKKDYQAVESFKNVYERLDAEGKPKPVKEFFYASGTAVPQVYNAALKSADGKFSIAFDCYKDAPGNSEAGSYLILNPLIKTNGTLDTANPAPPDPPPANLPKLEPLSGRVNLYELRDKDGISLSPIAYVYASSALANNELYLAAKKLNEKYYLRLAGDIFIAVAPDGTLDCNDVINAGADKKLGTADDAVLFPTPPLVFKYKAVESYKNLYEMLGADGKSKSPREYLYSTKAPEDGKAPPAASQQALAKGDAYYVSLVEDSGIFLAVSNDGTLNFGNAIWWGEDKLFNTKDDLTTSVREEGGYYYWQLAQGVWERIRGIFNPAYTTTTAPATTTLSLTSTTVAPVYRAVESYRSLFEVLNADGTSRSPKEYIYSETAPADGSAPPAAARAAFVRGDYFYVPLTPDSGIFLAVNTDGSINYSNAVWWGPDGRFGTADDFGTSVREQDGFYEWLQANGIWARIISIIHPTEPTTTTVSPHLTTREESYPPKTGKEPLNPGIAVCMALLLMGCAYCGFQAFRRRTIKVKAR